MARRRIEQASGLAHRPLEALADRPSGPLDGPAAALWAAHQRRMAEAVRRLRVGWPAAGLARRDPYGTRSVLAILLVLAAIDAGADWHDRVARALVPAVDGGSAAIAARFDLWLTPPEYTGLAPQRSCGPATAARCRLRPGAFCWPRCMAAQVPRLADRRGSARFRRARQAEFRVEAT